VDIELEMVRERIQKATAGKPFDIDITESAREFLLMEGTDSRYGARHLKRAIERLLIQPLSNLMASGQILRGDYVHVSHRAGAASLIFYEASAAATWETAGRVAA
jgi:ATP-dependent Clp protease ATP-binding subunit ClpA